MNDSTLWCMQIPGLGEVYAAPSREDAERMVDRFNRAMRRYFERHPIRDGMPVEPTLMAEVAPWPWSAEEHAKAVTRSAERYRTEGEP